MLATFICLAPLSGCMTTPVSSMVKLSQLSPLDAKPSDMRFAVRSPHYLRVRNGDISVTMSFDAGDEVTRFVEVYKPVIDENAIPGQGISIGTQDGSRLAIARLSEEDAVSMKALQTRIKALNAAGVEGEGRFSVSATGCAESQIPDKPILLTTWIRRAPSEDYFILTRNVDIRKLVSQTGSSPVNIPSCN